MRQRWLLPLGPAFGIAVGLASAPSCGQDFPTEVPGRSLSLSITGGNIGTPANRLPLTFTTPDVFTVTVQALDENGTFDPTFTGYVRLSIQPGTVVSVTGPNTNG